MVENPDHDVQLSRLSDENVAQILRAYLARMNDLKRDRRFRYVTVFHNQGTTAGGECDHPQRTIWGEDSEARSSRAKRQFL